jgi:hypothetical protein
MFRREAPRHQSAKVMPDQVHALRATRIDQCAHIVDQLRHPIIAATTRPGAARKAALIRR